MVKQVYLPGNHRDRNACPFTTFPPVIMGVGSDGKSPSAVPTAFFKAVVTYLCSFFNAFVVLAQWKNRPAGKELRSLGYILLGITTINTKRVWVP